MTPAERLTLALELSDLCEDLAAVGQRAPRATLDIDALAAVDAGRLEELPGFDRVRFAAWKKRLRVRG
jgi:hypothetical protein